MASRYVACQGKGEPSESAQVYICVRIRTWYDCVSDRVSDRGNLTESGVPTEPGSSWRHALHAPRATTGPPALRPITHYPLLVFVFVFVFAFAFVFAFSFTRVCEYVRLTLSLSLSLSLVDGTAPPPCSISTYCYTYSLYTQVFTYNIVPILLLLWHCV